MVILCLLGIITRIHVYFVTGPLLHGVIDNSRLVVSQWSALELETLIIAVYGPRHDT